MSLATRLLNINPGAQVSNALTGSLTTPSAKGAFIAPWAGYAVGGYNYAISAVHTGIQKLTFGNDSVSVLSAPIASTQVFYGGSSSNSGVAGYSINTNSNYLGVEKLTYSTESVSALSSTSIAGTASNTSMNNSAIAAYTAGGYDNGNTNRVQKFNYSTEVASQLGTTISEASRERSALSNRGTKGYSCGGYSTGWGTAVQQLNYSNETMSGASWSLPSAGGAFGSANNDQVSGFAFGDQDVNTYGSRIQKLVFSGETRSTLAATSTAGSGAFGFSYKNSGSVYRWSGWKYTTSTAYTSIDKLLVSNDSISTLSASVSTPTATGANLSNEGVF